MEKVYFRPCNGEMGLTPKTRAIMDAVKARVERDGPFDEMIMASRNTDEILKEWSKNNV